MLNATPLGMGGETLPIPAPGADQWVVDLIYHPAETPFLAAAGTRAPTWWAGWACSCTRRRSASRP